MVICKNENGWRSRRGVNDGEGREVDEMSRSVEATHVQTTLVS